jgi:NADPH-dependent ferric siderophore reductase
MTVETAQVPAYRTFGVHVARLRRLSPSFLRVTFVGPDLDVFTSNGLDQRIKVLLPIPGRGLVDCPTGPDWYGEWRALPAERQVPIRTYTVRAVRSDPAEVDVDFVLHGATGPASAWAETAMVGDEVVLVGPNALFEGPTGGFEWHPSADATSLLVAGDETAVPAICAIVESLPAGRRAVVLMEVPTADDALDVAAPAGVRVTWLPRISETGTSPRGLLLTRAVMAAMTEFADDLVPAAATDLDDVDIETGILWEVPPEAPRGAPGTYAWLAGEAGVVKGLRRHLVQEVGLPRTSVAFMGYWREGRESD